MAYDTMENKEAKGSGFSESVVLEVPSSSEYVLLTRLVVSCVGQLAGFGSEDIYDLKLAVTEAATNVIRHAAVSHFQIEFRVFPSAVEVTVTDAGGGFDVGALSAKPGEAEYGGFGLAVIRSLVDEVALDSTTSGTRLRMVRRASAA